MNEINIVVVNKVTRTVKSNVGPRGLKGDPGLNGIDGIDGQDGTNGLDGQNGAGALKVEYPVLSSQDISNKSVILSNMPSSAQDVLLDVLGGGAQAFGVDFTVSGNVLSWGSLALEPLLAESDKLRVAYQI